MPSSVKDRFTIDFEYLFFFSKNQKYFFNTQYEPLADCTKKRLALAIENNESYDPNKHKTPKGGQSAMEILVRHAQKLKKQDALGKHTYTGFNDRYVTPENGRIKRCVWRIPPTQFKGSHFATYPEKLCETPIDAGCPVGGIVLDPFFGAGTTGLVALKQKKYYLGIELNPEYIPMAKKRLHPERTVIDLSKDAAVVVQA